MAEKNAMLVMRDVSKTFNPGTVNEKCALKNLNLTLKQGDKMIRRSPKYSVSLQS